MDIDLLSEYKQQTLKEKNLKLQLIIKKIIKNKLEVYKINKNDKMDKLKMEHKF